jgi:hypothetical protein
VIRFAALLPLLAALTACGASAKPQSQLARQANAICITYSRAVDALKAPGSMAETATYAAKAHALFATSTRKLHQLAPRPADAAYYRAWLALERAARARDEATINALGKATTRARVKSDALALRLGFTACAAAG